MRSARSFSPARRAWPSRRNFPARTVHLIVPFTPGTGADLLARLLAPRLAERWKVAVVTENKAGATGNIGADFVARSAPDGHTLLFVATSFGTAPALSKSLPFDPVKSFAPVAVVATSALLVVAHPALAAHSVPDLVQLAKREPGKLHYSSPGSGGPQHLAMELLKLESGMDIVHVPYKGSAGALADVVAGHVRVTIAGLQTVQPHVRSGKLRALGVISGVETWYGIFAPPAPPRRWLRRSTPTSTRCLTTWQSGAPSKSRGWSSQADRPSGLANSSGASVWSAATR